MSNPAVPNPPQSDVSPPPKGGAARLMLRLLLGLVVLVLLAGVAFRALVWPEIQTQLRDPQFVERQLAAQLEPHGLRLEVHGLEPVWPEFSSPRVLLSNAHLQHSSGAVLAELSGVELILHLEDIPSLLRGRPAFSLIRIDELVLQLDRDDQGGLRLAGFPLAASEDDAEVSLDWLDGLGDLDVRRLGLRWPSSYEGAQDGLETLWAEGLQASLGGNSPRLALPGLDLHGLSRLLSFAAPEAMEGLAFGGQARQLSVQIEGLLSRWIARPDWLDQLADVDLRLEVGSPVAVGLGLVQAVELPDLRLQSRWGQGRLMTIAPGGLRLLSQEIVSRGQLETQSVELALAWGLPSRDSQGRLVYGLEIQNLGLDGPDIRLATAGRLSRLAEAEHPRLALKGSLAHVRPQDLSGLLPSVVGQQAREWLAWALVDGGRLAGEFDLEGPPLDFPFPEPGTGQFTARLEAPELQMNFAPGWPQIQYQSLVLRFDRNALSAETRQARLGDAALEKATASIADIGAARPILKVDGVVVDDLGRMVSTVNASPVRELLSGFLDSAVSSGPGRLSLGLQVDLSDPSLTKVQGDLQVQRARLDLGTPIPEATDLTGGLQFSEQGLVSLDVRGTALGGASRIRTSPSSALLGGVEPLSLLVEGRALAEPLEAYLRATGGLPLRGALQGELGYTLLVETAKGGLRLALDSPLQGLAVRLPAPLAKSASTDWALRLRLDRPPRPSAEAPVPDQQVWRLETASGPLTGWIVQQPKAGRLQGELGVGQRAIQPREDGIVIRAQAGKVRVEDWIQAASGPLAPLPQQPGDQPAGPGLKRIEVSASEARYGPLVASRARAVLRPTADGLEIALESDEASGRLKWLESRELRADLSRLYVQPPEARSSIGGVAAVDTSLTSIQEALTWPTLRIAAQDFKFKDMSFGRLEMVARPDRSSGSWRIDSLGLKSAGGQITGTGAWTEVAGRPGRPMASRTDLDLQMAIADGSQMLSQLGLQDVVKGAAGSLAGRLGWPGAPSDFDLNRLDGGLDLDIGQGQFLRVEPGVAKLISVLNLQSFSRRITLDFGDIFAKGFSFDTLRGRVDFKDGLARTDNLRMVGTQASVLISGSANLQRETQSLRVLVLPEVNAGLASLGYALINPAIGLGTFIAQFILRDPLREALAFQFQVEGPWAEPEVTELPRSALGAQPATGGTP